MSPADEIAALRRVVEAAREVCRERYSGTDWGDLAEAISKMADALNALPAAHPAGMTMLDAAKEAASWLASPVATPAEVEALRRERDALREEKPELVEELETALRQRQAARARVAELETDNARLREAAELAAPLLLAAAFLTHAVNEKASQCYEEASTKVRAALQEPTP
jgi:chromosome segregation ATPase